MHRCVAAETWSNVAFTCSCVASSEAQWSNFKAYLSARVCRALIGKVITFRPMRTITSLELRLEREVLDLERQVFQLLL